MFGSAYRTQAARRNRSSDLLLGLLGLAGILAISYLIIAGEVRLAITTALSFIVLVLAVAHIQTAIFAVIVYLVFMGDARRMLIPLVGWSGADPLLLISPIFALALGAYAWAARRITIDTPLTGWVLALTGVMALQMLNPLQGGIMVGVAGALFMLVPLLWFWIGRAYATEDFMQTLLLKVLLPLAGLAAVMGYYHTFYGYLPYQETWYEIAGYTALGARGIQSPISFFASSTEYGNFLLIALVILWALLLHKKQSWALLLLPVFFVAVFLTGSRGPIIKIVFTCAGLWAILARSTSTWVMRGAVAAVLGLVVLGGSLSALGPIGGDNERIEHRVTRQAEGLANPLVDESARTHFGMMLNGFRRGFQHPLGLGLGSTTRAASRFGDSGGGSTETDMGDVFVATGVVGGVIYLIIVFLTIRTALRYWNTSRSFVALCIVGILAATFLLWLRGGQYATSPLIWLCIGALDRFHHTASTDLSSSTPA